MYIKISKLLLAIALIFTALVGATGKANATTTGGPLQNGAWLGESPTSDNINAFQDEQGKKMDYVNMFIDFNQTLDPSDKFHTTGIRNQVDAIYNNGSQLILTWQPKDITDDDINNGKYDDYIYAMASQLKGFNKPIIIRLMHEVNSNWYSWATGYQNGGTNNYWSYISAYRRIVNAFRSSDVTNVKFMYNVNNFNVGNNTSYTAAYPGNDYVDIISIDGYNWGTKPQSWGIPTWQSFDQVFSSAYNAIKGYNKPIFISEIASAEQGGDKAAWITDAFNRIASGSYQLIDAVIWFNESKEADWRINSTSSSLAAYKAAITGVPIPTSKKWACEDANSNGLWDYSSIWGGNGSSIETAGQYNNLPVSTEEKYLGSSSLRFHFTHTSSNGYAVASIPTSTSDNGVEPTSSQDCNAGKNLTRTSYLMFNIKGNINSQARIRLVDIWGNETEPVELTKYVTVSNLAWKQVCIPMSDLTSSTIDKNNISNIRFSIDSNTYQPGEWTFYIDNMIFSN